MMEYRFVPKNWKSPIKYHVTTIITGELELIIKWRDKLQTCPPVTWYYDGGEAYTAEVSFDPTKRPILVCISGIR